MTRICLTRDSVAAGDDLHAPHKRIVRIGTMSSIPNLLEETLATTYLPRVIGGKASWVVVSQQPIAVCAQEWSGARQLSTLTTGLDSLARDNDGAIRLHFSYLAQLDPDQVFDVLIACVFRAP